MDSFAIMNPMLCGGTCEKRRSQFINYMSLLGEKKPDTTSMKTERGVEPNGENVEMPLTTVYYKYPSGESVGFSLLQFDFWVLSHMEAP